MTVYREKNPHDLKHNREPMLKAKERQSRLKSREAEGFKRLKIWERKERESNSETQGGCLNNPGVKKNLQSPSTVGSVYICIFDYLCQLIFFLSTNYLKT